MVTVIRLIPLDHTYFSLERALRTGFSFIRGIRFYITLFFMPCTETKLSESYHKVDLLKENRQTLCIGYINDS